MAHIKSDHVIIEMLPRKRRGNWIEMEVSIQYAIPPEQPIKFTAPSKDLRIRANEAAWFIEGLKNHLAKLPIYPPIDDFKSLPENKYGFLPMELGFKIYLSYGEYADETKRDGWISLDFMLSLRGFEETQSTDLIGCTLNVSLCEINSFVEALDAEFGKFGYDVVEPPLRK